LKVRSESQALALDIAATTRLKLYDEEREKRLLEALTAGAAAGALSGLTNSIAQSQPARNLVRQ
jgi:hypothetical protein